MTFLNASPNGVLEKYDMEDYSDMVNGMLPRSIILEDDTHISLPEFRRKDGQQTSCKMVQVCQTLLSSKTGGRERQSDLNHPPMSPRDVLCDHAPMPLRKRMRSKMHDRCLHDRDIAVAEFPDVSPGDIAKSAAFWDRPLSYPC